MFEMTAGDFSPENERKAWWVGDGKLVLIGILKYCSVSMWWSVNDLEQRKTFSEYFLCNSKRGESQKAHEGETRAHIWLSFFSLFYVSMGTFCNIYIFVTTRGRGAPVAYILHAVKRPSAM